MNLTMKHGMTQAVAGLALMGLALAPLTASAQSRVDGRVTIDNPRIAAALKEAVGKPTLQESVIRKVGPLIYADNKLSDSENDLLLELMTGSQKRIEVSTPEGDHFVLPPISVGARALVQLSNPPDLNELWLQGPGPMKQLVDVILLNPNVGPQIQKFVGQQLFLSWRASNAVNSYKPTRDTINAALMQWKLAGGDVEARGKALLYEAMKAVDASVQGKVPDSVYSDLKPQD